MHLISVSISIMTTWYIICLQIEEIRQQTKAEKKRLAMAVRKKQLGALGMTVSYFRLLCITQSTSNGIN